MSALTGGSQTEWCSILQSRLIIYDREGQSVWEAKIEKTSDTKFPGTWVANLILPVERKTFSNEMFIALPRELNAYQIKRTIDMMKNDEVF